jgi:hypothetical protein
MHVDEVRRRKDHRGVDLISDVLQFGRLLVRRAKRSQQRNRAHGILTISMIQLVSQVLPPSSENACSQCGLVARFVHKKRTRIGFPLKVSSA